MDCLWQYFIKNVTHYKYGPAVCNESAASAGSALTALEKSDTRCVSWLCYSNCTLLRPRFQHSSAGSFQWWIITHQPPLLESEEYREEKAVPIFMLFPVWWQENGPCTELEVNTVAEKQTKCCRNVDGKKTNCLEKGKSGWLQRDTRVSSPRTD